MARSKKLSDQLAQELSEQTYAATTLEENTTVVPQEQVVAPSTAGTFTAEDLAKLIPAIISALPVSNSSGDLRALVAELAASRPKQYKQIGDFKGKTPWSAAPGEVKPRLKRKFFQHGVNVDEDMLSASTIRLINKLRPGLYFDNWVLVTRRRDKGIDITYKVKTAADRMVLPARFGITSIDQLLQGCVDQAANPKPQIEDTDTDSDN